MVQNHPDMLPIVAPWSAIDLEAIAVSLQGDHCLISVIISHNLINEAPPVRESAGGDPSSLMTCMRTDFFAGDFAGLRVQNTSNLIVQCEAARTCNR